MKGLKKIVLVSAIAAISAGAQAELKALDDSTMGEMTGQAGLTIDLQTAVTIGEFAYHDAGYLVLQGIKLGGNQNEVAWGARPELLDNIRLTIDVAGNGTVPGDNAAQYGFSEVRGLAGLHYKASGDTNFGAAATGAADVLSGGTAVLGVDGTRTVGDGDLTIHFGFTDAWQKGGGFAAYATGVGDDGAGNMNASLASLTYAAAREIATRAVDFGFEIDLIGIAASNYTVGSAAIEATNHTTGLDATPETTALISGLKINGYLGPADIHIENNGNGFGAGAGVGDADSKIHWDSYFKVTDLDVYIDIAGVQITDMKIHNERGDRSGLDGTSSFGFAHSNRDIFAVKDAVLNLTTLVTGSTGSNLAGYVDAIAINCLFKGDMDIGALSFGDTGTSIGSLYWTDINSTSNWTISAH